MFTFEYYSAEDKADDQEKTSRCLQADNLVSIASVPSPAKKDDVELPVSVDITEVSPINVEHPQSTAKTEKGSSEEGFCCVMSMNDGVVL